MSRDTKTDAPSGSMSQSYTHTMHYYCIFFSCGKTAAYGATMVATIVPSSAPRKTTLEFSALNQQIAPSLRRLAHQHSTAQTEPKPSHPQAIPSVQHRHRHSSAD